MQKSYALILGIVAAIVGVWGLFSEMILGIFGVNLLQSVVHLITAGCGIYAGTKGEGKTFNMLLGWIALALGVLGFVPGVKDLLTSLLNINAATSVLHLAVGIVSLGVYYGASQ